MAIGYEACFSDLDTAAEEVQAHFQEQITHPRTNGEADAFCRLQLAVHEWISNLIDHACFGGRAPEVHVRTWQQNGRLRCVVEDNSEGFDLDGELDPERQIFEEAQRLPERGMGLLLMQASTEEAEYTSLDYNGNRLTLAVVL